mgnify:CR=1 FL=1
MIIFTDGEPGSGSNLVLIEHKAIAEVYTSKNSYHATAYTVGIFSGADATTPIPDNTSNANKFMHYMSSNFENATSMSAPGDATYPDEGSYYLSAADADSLNDIFQQIADNIETGGTSSTLTENAVIKDVISDQFELPEGANADDITLKTYSYTGENQWEENVGDTMGATATVDGSKVNVTGFDFSENYVGTVTEGSSVTYRGDKLVISFTVKAQDGFLGGNNVYTNTSAGIYENSTAEEPVKEFDRPQVNVPIKDIAVTAAG